MIGKTFTFYYEKMLDGIILDYEGGDFWKLLILYEGSEKTNRMRTMNIYSKAPKITDSNLYDKHYLIESIFGDWK